jgi:hypothetical protein
MGQNGIIIVGKNLVSFYKLNEIMSRGLIESSRGQWWGFPLFYVRRQYAKENRVRKQRKTEAKEIMDELFIVGLRHTITVMEALVDSGYAVKVQLFLRQESEGDFADLIDKNIYSIIYETTEEQQ